MNAFAASTWGVPIAGALHVLGMALFGGALLLPEAGLRALKRIGLGVLLATGLALLLSQPERIYHSRAFWVKMLLLGAALIAPARKWTLLLWVGVIVAARGIAFV